jgi:cob(I)alamin adenosyltransferase
MANRLTKIYTRTGDDGTTGKADGSRIAKDDGLIAAIGDVDELNSVLATVIVHAPEDFTDSLHSVQNRLFDIGAELAMTGSDYGPFPGINADDVAKLEQELDALNDKLEPLKEFILPGGCAAAAHCHHARAVCRRAERSLVSVNRVQALSAELMAYVNRLSDYLFVLARSINHTQGVEEILWDSDKRKMKNEK